MSDHQDILSFRGLKRVPPETAAGSGQPSPSDAAMSTAPGSDADADRSVLPLSRHSGPQPFTWHDLRDEQPLAPVQIHLGRARVPSSEAKPPKVGAIVVLDRTIDEPVEIVVAGAVIGWGRIVVARNKLAIQVSQVKPSLRARRA